MSSSFEFPPEDAGWQRLTELFEQMLNAPDPLKFLEAQSDAEIRNTLMALWHHHEMASQAAFLETSMEFQALPVFQPGQTLLQRFDISHFLGVGGMGEVYLALDRKLGERVAIKTVARLLTHATPIRRRFLSEVQNARRVTHPNVCRIYDLFEDGETAFFSMEYLDGELLNVASSHRPFGRGKAKEILIQLAAGLQAAHRSGVVHGDFKPVHVMLLKTEPVRAVIMDFGLALALGQESAISTLSSGLAGGTRDYMAPELMAGQKPTHLSDIYAFGKVAELLLPGRKLWRQCTEADPKNRIQSLAQVISDLEGRKTRRVWLASIPLASAAYLLYRSSPSSSRLSQLIETNAHLVINGFHSADSESAAARAARGLLATGLQQSPRVHVVPDVDLLKSLQALDPASKLPVAAQVLRQMATLLKAAYCIQARLARSSGRYALTVQLIRTDDGQTLAQTHLADLLSVGPLATAAASWLRRIAGESDESISLNSPDAVSFTSRVPEALESYYAAMNLYAAGKMEEAIPFLQEAIRLDPNFVQAMNVLGGCFNTISMFAEAFELLDRAHKLSVGLPVRERSWLEASYYGLVEDPDLGVKSAQANLNFHPDEPRFYRILARQLCWADRAEESIPLSRKAVELAPGAGLFESELIFNLSEAGHFAEALDEYHRFRAAGVQNPYLEYSSGFALMGLERYEQATPYLAALSDDAELRYQTSRLLAGQVEGAIAALRESLTRSEQLQNVARQYKCHEFLCCAYYLTDRRALAQQHLAGMINLPSFPPFARLLQCAAWWALRLEDYSVLNSVQSSLEHIARLWPNGLTKAALAYSEAVIALRRNDMDGALGRLSESMGACFTLWPAWEMAYQYTVLRRFDLADDAWRQFESRRGTLLKLWSPAALLLAWLHHSDVAMVRGDTLLAGVLEMKLSTHWSGPYKKSQVRLKAELTN